MQRYTKTITVLKEHLDQNEHVNNIVYLQWAQAIAREHWLSLASSEITENYFWVVLSHHIQYKAQAVLNDVIELTTYVPFADGVKSKRIVEMHHAITKKLIVKVETEWCFMDKARKRPTKIPQEIVTIFD